MKIIKTAILSVVAAILSLSGGVAVADGANGEYTVFGIGGQSCAKFLNDEKESDTFKTAYLTWVGGFMTAAGRYNDTQKAFRDVADIHGIMHLIRDYCDENPLDSLANAANYVARGHLLPKAGYR